jgi:LuxR family transcriptional regulator, maltose regulon positive regulatory protein
VPRPALIERVQRGLIRPLTLVAAPAGFGKTTLLIQALAPNPAHAAFAFAWLALDPEENTPLRFWMYVAAALDRAVPGLGAAAQARLQDAPPPTGQDLATTLINAAAELPAEPRVLLVLDDYHVLTAPELHIQVGFLLDHLPPQLRVAILTRADPPLALPRRRAHGDVSEFRATDLRFTHAEIQAFFQQAGVTLDPAGATALEQRTEGWAASLQLAALAMEAGPGAGPARLTGLLAAERNLLDYLADEVLAGLEPALQGFLLRTAILDRLSAALCAAVLDQPEPDVAARLQQIETAGLFLIALDATGHWYRYHHLFAELLQIRLQREYGLPAIADLHRSAGAWHAAHGDVDAAVRHNLAAGDPPAAAAVVEQRYLEAVRRVDGAALASWLAPLPPGLIAARPGLMLADAWRALLHLDLPSLQHILPWLVAPPPELPPALRAEAALLAGRLHLFAQQADQAQTSAQVALAELPPNAAFLRGMALLNLGLAQRLRGDLGGAETALAAAAQEGYAAEDAATFMTAILAQANVRQVQGDLAGAEHLLRRAALQAHQPAGAAIPLAELALINLGWLYTEQNRLDEAITLLEDGLAQARRRQSRRGLLDGATFLALAYAMRGDRAATQRNLAEAQALAAQVGPGIVATIVAERTARAQILLGDTAAARPWALQIDPQQPVEELSEDLLLTLVRYKLAEHSATRDQRLLHSALEVLDRLHRATDERIDRRIRVLTLNALAWAAGSNPSAAHAALHTALRLAAPGGFVRTFVNCGAPMHRLLANYAQAARTSAAQSTADIFAERLLAAFGAEPEPLAPQSRLAEPLTEREQEVLQLIAAGHSNAAIAEQLMVAVTTVKAHLRSIFGKLEVGSRTQAVARARTLGLVE